MSPLRIVLGLILLAAAGWLGWALFITPPTPPAPARAFTSSKQCQECHTTAYAEWEVSWHAQAWTDPEPRKLSNDFSNTDCIDCHAPQPVFETGLGNRVLPRATRRVEGVDCIACHQLANGGMAGTITNPTPPCRPQEQRDLVQAEFCAPCHNQHGTVQQWQATPFAQAGPGFRTCIDCHMPYREGDPSKGRDHTMAGGHDMDLVRSAVELRARREAGKVVVEIENVGAGHNYPTDDRSRASDLFWRPLAAAGATPEAWRHLYRFRNPYRYEVGLENTELAYGKTLEVEVDDAAAAGTIEVALFFKTTPYWSDPEHPDPEGEAHLVRRVEVAP